MKLGGEKDGEKLGGVGGEDNDSNVLFEKNSKVKTIAIKILLGIHAPSFLWLLYFVMHLSLY